jgi:putative flippase GtrA
VIDRLGTALLGDRYREIRALWSRIWRYATGSIITLGLSQLLFFILFTVGRVTTAHNSAIISTLAGAVPSYFINRYWAWGKRSRSALFREVLPYFAMAISSLIFSTWSTDFANTHRALFGSSSLVRGLGVQGAYFLSFAIMWLAKFTFMQKWLFAHKGEQVTPA